jgi:hypothetical protein
MLVRDEEGNLHLGLPIKYRDEPGSLDPRLPALGVRALLPPAAVAELAAAYGFAAADAGPAARSGTSTDSYSHQPNPSLRNPQPQFAATILHACRRFHRRRGKSSRYETAGSFRDDFFRGQTEGAAAAVCRQKHDSHHFQMRTAGPQQVEPAFQVGARDGFGDGARRFAVRSMT